MVVAFWRFPNGKVFELALYEAHQSSVARMSTAKSVFGWVVVVVEVSEVNELLILLGCLLPLVVGWFFRFLGVDQSFAIISNSEISFV